MGRMSSVSDYTGTRNFSYAANGNRSLNQVTLPSFYGGNLTYSYNSTSSTTKVRGALASFSHYDGAATATWSYATDSSKGRLNQVGLSGDGQSLNFDIGYGTGSNHVTSISDGTYTATREWESWRENRTAAKSSWTDGSTRTMSDFSLTNIDWHGQYNYYALVNNTSYTGDLHDKFTGSSSNILIQFEYDKRGQLTKFTRGDSAALNVNTYGYDSAGNMTSIDYVSKPDISHSYNHANQHTTGGLKYSDNGNLSEDADWKYYYDSYNRLYWMDDKSSANDDLRFYYDYMGRRVKKEVYDNGSVSETTKYLYDGMTLIAELKSNGRFNRTMCWGPDKSDAIGGAGGAEGLVYMRDWDEDENLYPSYDLSGNLSACSTTAGPTFPGTATTPLAR